MLRRFNYYNKINIIYYLKGSLLYFKYFYKANPKNAGLIAIPASQ